MWRSLLLCSILFAGGLRAGEVDMKQGEMAQALRQHVVALAEDIGARGVHAPDAYRRARDYIVTEPERVGYKPRLQTYQVEGVDCSNIEAEIRGTRDPDKIILIGAHYDTVRGTGGANDNSSGVAALLVLAAGLKDSQPGVTLRFVAFANEEPPYFQTSKMGSVVNARACRNRGENIIGMLSLETIGYFSEEPNSQKYPAPFDQVYPSTGNFIGFVANVESKPFLTSFVEAFAKHSRIPHQSAAVPDRFPGVGWSDHWSFWQEGYPAVMVTDTAPFRYPHYHLSSDTPDKLLYPLMAEIVTALDAVIRDLAK